MATSNQGLNNALPQLVEGQEQKEAAINQAFINVDANMDLLDAGIPVFMGELASQPASGTAPIGSRYWNTTTPAFWTLTGKSPDVWRQG